MEGLRGMDRARPPLLFTGISMKPLLLIASALLFAGPASSQNELGSDALASRLRPSTRASSQLDAFFDQLAYDEPGDGRLWVMGPDFKASFGPDGCLFVPYLGSDARGDASVRLRLASASLAERALPLTERAEWWREGDVVTLDRGAVLVRYRISREGIEQTFVLDELPELGALVVEVDIASQLPARSLQQGGFLLEGDQGGVHYGSATVLDSGGRSRAVSSRLQAGRIAIEVPRDFIEQATLPLVIDPVIRTYTVNGNNSFSSYEGEVAIDATNGIYYHVYERKFTDFDKDVFAAAYNLQGDLQIGLSAWIDMTNDDWRQVSVANNAAGQNFLVSAIVGDFPAGVVRGRMLQLPAATLGASFLISNFVSDPCTETRVGGDSAGGDRYCVAIVEKHSDTDYDVRYRLVRNDGLLIGGVLNVDGSPDTQDYDVDISKTTGTGDALTRRWNLVWKRPMAPNVSQIRGAQISSTGLMVTPSFAVDSRPVYMLDPAVSPPLDAPDGGPRDYLVVYRTYEGNGAELQASLLKEGHLLNRFNLTQLEADAVGPTYPLADRFEPSVCTDGSMFVVAYMESESPISPKDIYVSGFHHFGNSLLPVEPHTQVSTTSESHNRPEIASAHDAGVAASRDVVLSWWSSDVSLDRDTQGAIYRTPAGWQSIGWDVCDGLPNTTGDAATMRIVGDRSLAANRFYFDIDNLPHFQWGYPVMSMTSTQIPLYSGLLCLGNPRVRLNPLLSNSFTQGTVGMPVDFSAIPQAAVISAGSLWFFQYWYRDVGTSNFSNCAAVLFE